DIEGANDVVIDGVSFQLKPGGSGIAVFVSQSSNVTIKNSSISGKGFAGIFSAASSIHILNNRWTGMFSGALILGGTAAANASVEMTGNSGHGNFYGTCIIGDSGFGETSGVMTAVVTHNDFSQNGVDCNGGMPDFGAGIQVLPTSFS